MIELPDLMVAIAAKVKTETGLATADYFPEGVNPPFAFTTLDTVREESFGSGSYGTTINVVVLVPAQDARTGQRLIYEYLSFTSPSSLFNALTVDGTFGLDGVSSHPGEFRSLGAEETAAYRYYGGVLPLEVTVT